MFHCWKERNEVETSPSIFPDPAGGYKYPETKNVSAILYRRSPFERPCRVADTKRLCFRTTFLPRFHSSAERAGLRVTACRPSFPPSDRRRPCELPDFRLPAIRPTFIFKPLRTNLSTPKIKKVANIRLQPNRPSGRLRRERGFEPPEPRSSTVFKTAAIDHSAISPSAKV